MAEMTARDAFALRDAVQQYLLAELRKSEPADDMLDTDQKTDVARTLAEALLRDGWVQDWKSEEAVFF